MHKDEQTSCENRNGKKRVSGQLHAAESGKDDNLWQPWLAACHFLCHPVK